MSDSLHLRRSSGCTRFQDQRERSTNATTGRQARHYSSVGRIPTPRAGWQTLTYELLSMFLWIFKFCRCKSPCISLSEELVFPLERWFARYLVLRYGNRQNLCDWAFRVLRANCGSKARSCCWLFSVLLRSTRLGKKKSWIIRVYRLINMPQCSNRWDMSRIFWWKSVVCAIILIHCPLLALLAAYLDGTFDILLSRRKSPHDYIRYKLVLVRRYLDSICNRLYLGQQAA